jgi:hypothetical protein
MSNELESDRAMVMKLESFGVDADSAGHGLESEASFPRSPLPRPQPHRPPSARRVRCPPAPACACAQRLVAKPEHNGKRARVLSFDARTGRYAVALDDGKELSLKAECVARAGCAAAGWDARPTRRRRAACALDARRCGTARASASAQTGRRTS